MSPAALPPPPRRAAPTWILPPGAGAARPAAPGAAPLAPGPAASQPAGDPGSSAALSLKDRAIAALAKRLGMPVWEVRRRLAAGESLADIAASRGVSRGEAVAVVAADLSTTAAAGSGIPRNFDMTPIAAALVDGPGSNDRNSRIMNQTLVMVAEVTGIDIDLLRGRFHAGESIATAVVAQGADLAAVTAGTRQLARSWGLSGTQAQALATSLLTLTRDRITGRHPADPDAAGSL